MITGLGHVAVFTTDIEASIRYYEEKLGGTLKMRSQAKKPTGVNLLALVEVAGVTIELIEPGDGTEIQRISAPIPHLCFAVEDLPATIEELKEKGVDTFLTAEMNILPEVFGGLRNIFFTGPSGEQLELLEML